MQPVKYAYLIVASAIVMAGGISKTFGSLFIFLSILLILGGTGAAGFAFFQENQNHDRGLFADPHQTDQNQQFMVFGAMAAAAGVVLLILGLILTSVGGSLRERALRRAVLEASASRIKTRELEEEAEPEPVAEVAPISVKPRASAKSTRKAPSGKSRKSSE
jgi:hypothetical protein